MESIFATGRLTKSHAAQLAALLCLSVSAWGQISPCDLNRDGVVDGADVNLAVDMALGTAACTANVEGSGNCTVLTVQRVMNASRGRACSVTNPFSIASPISAISTTGLNARMAVSTGSSAQGLTASGLEFYPMTPCRLVDTRGLAAGFNGIAPFSGPSIAPGATLTIPVQSAAEASANTEPAPCGVIPSTAQAYSFNLTVVPQAGGAVDYVSLWAAGATKPIVATLDDPEGLIVANAAIVPAGSPSGGVSVFNAGPSTTDVIIDMNGYFAPPSTGLQFFPVAPCRLVDTRGAGGGFNGIAPFSGPSIAAASTLTIPVQSAAEASADTTPAPCGVIPSAAQAYSFNLTVVPQDGGAVDYVSMWPSGSARPVVATLDDPQGEIVANAAIVPAGNSSGGVSVYNAGPSATDVILDMNGYFATPTFLQFYPVAPCRLVDTRGLAAGFNGIAPFSGPSIPAASTLTIPVQSAAEAIANTEPAPCGVIPSTAQAYSFNLTVVPHAGGAVDYVSMWASGATRPIVATLDDPQGEVVANAAIVPAGTSSGGVNVYNAGPSAMDVIIDMNGYFAPPTVVGAAPVIVSATSAGGTTGTAFSYQIVATNSPTSYSATGLPAGLSINTATGLISGTPTSVGIPIVALGATNGSGTGTANLTLTITLGAPSITSAGSASGTAGTAFSYQITATSSPTSFSATGLPAGLSVNTSTGLISGTPTAAGTSTVTLGATNSGGTGHATLTLTITLGAPVITSATSAGGTVGSAFSYQITATNSPTSYSATGLPAGLSVNTSTGLISGTPTAAGTSTVTLGATNSGGTGNATLTLTITAAAPVITSATSAGGTVGSAFSYQITATNSPISYSATGLPAGLSVNTSTGLISGTPTAAGTSTVTLGATNSGGTGHATLTLTITLGAPVITSATSAGGTVGSAFSYQIAATNSPTSYSATGLPAGLSGNTSTGLISGTPTAAGTSTVTLGATNGGGTGHATLTLTITLGAPVITSATSAGGTVGSAFSYQIAATNSPTSYSATGLPAGLSVNTSTGLISGTPTAAGTSTVTLGATNSGGTGNATLTLTITAAAPVITSATSAGGTVGSAFSYQITATNSPISYSATGLPAGLSVNTSTGLISGTPTAAGTSTVTLGATNSGGTGHATLTLTITLGAPVITSATSAGGTVGSAFSYQIAATNSPISYSATGLPAGLSVNTSTGLISGTPTAAGTSTVTLGATNSGGTGHATLTLTITLGAPVITSATSAGGTVGSAFSYQIAATNSPTSYSATGLPAGLSVNTSTGLISGTPTAAGTSTVTLGATNSGGTGNATLTLTITAAAPVITSATSAGGTVGSAFSYQITATNSPTSYSATGLPAGLSVKTSTGLISGTPTAAGTSTVTLGATNSGGTGHATLTLTITHTVTLTWVASTSPNISGYNIYRGTTSLSGPYGATPVNPALITTTTYVDTSVAAGTTYYYVATAVNTSGVQSGDSIPVTAVIPSP